MKRLLYIFYLILFFVPFLTAQVETEEFLEDAVITQIAEEANYIWVATYGQGIFRFSKKDEKWENFSTKNNNLEHNLFYNIAVSKDYVWAGTSEGLFIFDKKRNRWRKRKFALGGEFGNWIRALLYDKKDNVLWIGRFRNLTHFDVTRQKFTDIDRTQENDERSNNFQSISLDGDSVVWFGSESGVHKYNKKSEINDKRAWQFISNKQGFNGDGKSVSVTGFLFEREYVWFGTGEFFSAEQPEFNIGGLYRYDRRVTWDRLSRKTGLPGNGIYCIERTGNKIWAGVYSFNKNEKKEFGKGLILIDRFTGIATPIDLNLTNIKSSTILSLYFDGSNMWVGTDNGLYKIRILNPLAEFKSRKESRAQNRKR